MTTSDLEATWGTLKGKLKQRYGQLTDDDLIFVEGKGEELLSRLQERLGLSRNELDWILEDLAAADGTVEQVKAKAAQVSDQLRSTAAEWSEDAQARGAAVYSQAQQRVRGLRGDGEEYVRANPIPAVLGALAVGLLAGLIVYRR